MPTELVLVAGLEAPSPSWGEVCPVPCPWLPSLWGDWLPPTQGAGRIALRGTEAPGPHCCQPRVVLRSQRPPCSSGPGPALSGEVLLLLWVPDLPSCLLVGLRAFVMTRFHPDNPGHTPHLYISSLVTNISEVPHSSAQVSIWWVTGALGRHL